ncbi:MAG: hypothetical protein IJR13_05605 [Bacteroidales bacterium]|nr:hypothetical protein [Bacteroidales bacterium]
MTADRTAIHSEMLELMSYHCDRTDHLSLWGLCRIFQEASAHDTDNSPIGYAELLQDGKGWVLTRMYYEMYSMPRMRDRVEVRTWSRGTDGLIAVREFLMLSEQGEPLCSASTYWVVIDMMARRVVRIKDLMASWPLCNDCATSKESFSKLRLGAFDDDCCVAQVCASDAMIDHTQHVNNAEYIKMMSDNMPYEWRDATCRLGDNPTSVSRFDGTCFQIDFPAESKPSELLRLYKKEQDESMCFQVVNPRGVSAVARFQRLG